MKILESYKEIARELFREGDLGENPYAEGKEPKPGDWWKSSEGQDYAMGKDGERQGPFNNEKEAENSSVSCSPASAFSWRWHSSFYICHSDGS